MWATGKKKTKNNGDIIIYSPECCVSSRIPFSATSPQPLKMSEAIHKGVEVTDESVETNSNDQNPKNVVNEKTGEVSVESPQDDDTEYVKGHPVIRTGMERFFRMEVASH